MKKTAATLIAVSALASLTATASATPDYSVHRLHTIVRAGHVVHLNTPQTYDNAALAIDVIVNGHSTFDTADAENLPCGSVIYARMVMVEGVSACVGPSPIHFRVTTLQKRARVTIKYWRIDD